jgi:hypothetical protein
MAWSNSYRATIERSGLGADTFAVASHDGYARGPEGVRHRRAVWLRPGRYAIVWDEFEGRGTHTIEVNYQFAPGTLSMAAPGLARFGGGAEMAWLSGQAWDASIHSGGAGPDEGWICPSLGVRVSAPRLQLTFRGAVERTVLVAVLAAPMSAGTDRLAIGALSGAHAIRVALASGADWVTLDPAVSTVTADGQVVERKPILEGQP